MEKNLLTMYTKRALRVCANRRAHGATTAAIGSAALLVTAMGQSAHADVTIVSQSTSSGSGMKMFGGGGAGAKPTNAQETTTTYIKGHKMRIETPDMVVIMDGDNGKRYLLTPSKKTYFALADASRMRNPLAAMAKITATGTVKATGAKRMVAGHMTSEYVTAMTIDMSLNPGAMPMNPQASGNAAAMKPQHLGTVKVTGSYWVAPIASLPNGGSRTVSLYSAQMMAELPGMKDMAAKFDAIPGVPLATQTSTTTQFAMFGMMGGAPGASGAPPKPTSTEKSEATSVRESPLPDSLFTVPADYKKAEMPMPGGGGIRRRPAQL